MVSKSVYAFTPLCYNVDHVIAVTMQVVIYRIRHRKDVYR